MTPEQTAYDAANDIIRTYLTVARQNEGGIIADLDSEFLHDYRVALRKMRSVVSLFRDVYDEAQTAALKRDLSDLMAPTGRLRDLDVYLLERGTYRDLLPEALHDGLALMFDIFKRERRREHRKLVKRLQDADYAAQIKALENLFPNEAGPSRGPDAEHPAFDYACGLIWKRYRKVCKIAAGINDDTPDSEVHELRINCKKLRYLMELFAPLFPRGRLKSLLSPLKELQENLGLFNDYSVQQVAMQDFLIRHPLKGQDGLAMATSIGALIAILHQRQMQERARVVSSFEHFDSPAIRQEFANLFRRKGA
nr:CHAD domain-containing protein [Paracoccus aestuariivivens]